MNRAEITQKVNQALPATGLDALLVSGFDHIHYLSGVPIPSLSARLDEPVLVLWLPLGPVYIAPARLETTLRTLGWSEDLRIYPACAEPSNTALDLAVSLVAERLPHKPRIGVDLERTPAGMVEKLASSLPGCTITACDSLLRSLRAVKTSSELELLEDIAARTDHGIAGAIHHVSVLGGRTEKFQAEDIRVHCSERGLDVSGYHAISQTASGEHARKFWPLAPRYGLGQEKPMKPGEIIRMEMRATLSGYWSDAARVLVMGTPTPEQSEAYQHLVALRQAAVDNIRPGIKASEVFEAVRQIAQHRSAPWIETLGAGHGTGVTPCEAPYLAPWDDTTLTSGMVLIIDLAVRLPVGEIIRAKDTLVVTPQACRITSWYQDWRQPYIAALTF